MYVYMLLRDAEGKKKEAKNNKAKQHSTPKAVTFPKKKEPRVGFQHTTVTFPKKKEPRVGFEPTTLHTLDRALYQLLSWLSPNLTSHSTPDKQANHMYMLEMKEERSKQARSNKQQCWLHNGNVQLQQQHHLHVHVHT